MRRRHPRSAVASSLFLAVLLFACIQSAHAQAVDFRYAATAPVSVRYISTDTMQSVLRAAQGTVRTTALGRTVAAVRIEPDPKGIQLTTQLTEATVTVSMPSGERTISLPLSPSVTAVLNHRGQTDDPAQAMLQQHMPPDAMMPVATAFLVVLVPLPDRTLERGESWADSTYAPMSQAGLEGSVRTVVHGTYVADTTVAGQRLHVLHLRTSSDVEFSGEVMSTRMKASVSMVSEEHVLWDPARRIPVLRDAERRMNQVADMEGRPGGLTMNSRIRSILRVEDFPEQGR